jgi:hypothetical protein
MQGGKMQKKSTIAQAQIEVYRREFLEHGDSAKSTFNVERAYQRLRFDRLLRPLPSRRSPFSIHDVGAGLCDLHAYLLEQGVEHRYSGTELVGEMVELARSKYPGVELAQRDVLTGDETAAYDFVVSSGMFNIPGKSDRAAWQEFVEQTIVRMYEMATHAVSFNFLTSHRTRSDPTLHYIAPAALFEFCQRLSRFVVVDHAYPLYECTIAVIKPATMREGHDDPLFAKYFANVAP